MSVPCRSVCISLMYLFTSLTWTTQLSSRCLKVVYVYFLFIKSQLMCHDDPIYGKKHTFFIFILFDAFCHHLDFTLIQKHEYIFFLNLQHLSLKCWLSNRTSSPEVNYSESPNFATKWWCLCEPSICSTQWWNTGLRSIVQPKGQNALQQVANVPLYKRSVNKVHDIAARSVCISLMYSFTSPT